MFKKLKIRPLYSQCILFLILFVVKNKDFFTPNYGLHTIHTRHSADLHPPLLHLSKSQNGVHFLGIKIFNCLPQYIKELSHDVIKFSHSLKNFLLVGSFYLPEFFFFAWETTPDLGNI
jgi:hypothetical protein